MKRWALFLVMLLSVSLVLLPGVSAADEKMTGRIFQHSTKTEIIEVGDVPGHILGAGQHAGLITYSTGEIGTVMVTYYFDYVKGKGTFTNYLVATFRDGSTQVTKGNGTATPVDGGKRTAWEGTIECIGGTGKWEGIKGTGTFKGERIGDMKTGADSYVDFTLICKKP